MSVPLHSLASYCITIAVMAIYAKLFPIDFALQKSSHGSGLSNCSSLPAQQSGRAEEKNQQLAFMEKETWRLRQIHGFSGWPPLSLGFSGCASEQIQLREVGLL